MAAGPDSGLASEAPNFSPILSVWKTGAFTTPAEGLGVKWREVLHSARDPEGYLELVSELPSETAMHPGELLKWPLVSVTSLLGHSATPCRVFGQVHGSADGNWRERKLFSNEGHGGCTLGPCGALCLHFVSEAVLGSGLRTTTPSRAVAPFPPLPASGRLGGRGTRWQASRLCGLALFECSLWAVPPVRVSLARHLLHLPTWLWGRLVVCVASESGLVKASGWLGACMRRSWHLKQKVCFLVNLFCLKSGEQFSTCVHEAAWRPGGIGV